MSIAKGPTGKIHDFSFYGKGNWVSGVVGGGGGGGYSGVMSGGKPVFVVVM